MSDNFWNLRYNLKTRQQNKALVYFCVLFIYIVSQVCSGLPLWCSFKLKQSHISFHDQQAFHIFSWLLLKWLHLISIVGARSYILLETVRRFASDAGNGHEAYRACVIWQKSNKKKPSDQMEILTMKLLKRQSKRRICYLPQLYANSVSCLEIFLSWASTIFTLLRSIPICSALL